MANKVWPHPTERLGTRIVSEPRSPLLLSRPRLARVDSYLRGSYLPRYGWGKEKRCFKPGPVMRVYHHYSAVYLSGIVCAQVTMATDGTVCTYGPGSKIHT